MITKMTVMMMMQEELRGDGLKTKVTPTFFFAVFVIFLSVLEEGS